VYSVVQQLATDLCLALALDCRRYATHAGSQFRLVSPSTGVTLEEYQAGKRAVEGAGCGCGGKAKAYGGL
jgi:hypothetical protein